MSVSPRNIWPPPKPPTTALPLPAKKGITTRKGQQLEFKF